MAASQKKRAGETDARERHPSGSDRRAKSRRHRPGRRSRGQGFARAHRNAGRATASSGAASTSICRSPLRVVAPATLLLFLLLLYFTFTVQPVRNNRIRYMVARLRPRSRARSLALGPFEPSGRHWTTCEHCFCVAVGLLYTTLPCPLSPGREFEVFVSHGFK
jgi:hypothetical protein